MEDLLSLLSINNIYPLINYESNNELYNKLIKEYVLNKLNYKKKSFGVFITIERELDRLLKWPEEVHGCLGDYDNEFFQLTSKDLLEKSIRLGSRTAFIDNRKIHFQPLIMDYLANVKVSVMLLPVYSVNKNGYIQYKSSNKTMKKNNKYHNTSKLKLEKFSNDKYGLIVKSNNNSRATYLPHVFPNTTTWNNISGRLKGKGGITTINSRINYYAYKTDEIKVSLIDFFTNKFILSLKYLEIIKAMKFNSYGIPIYSINYHTNKEIYDETQYVRNCGICSDILKAFQFIKKYLDNTLLKSCLNIINSCKNYLLSISKLFKKSNSSKAKLRQAMSFVVVGLLYTDNFEIYNNLVNNYCNYIVNNINKLEKQFEYGECFVALFTAIKYGIYNISKKKQLWITKTNEIIKQLNTNTHLNDIFMINWLIQMICLEGKYNITLLFTKLINILESYYFNKLTEQLNKENNNIYILVETNYLAVAYEACMNIYFLRLKDLSIEEQNKLKKYICLLSNSLIMRKTNNGLYTFKSGEVRYDISGHTIVV